MKNIYLVLALMIFICGCSSAPEQKKDVLAPEMPGVAPAEMKDTGNLDTAFKDNKRRLEHAIIARDRYIQLLRDAKTVEEVDRIKTSLGRAQEDVEFLQLELEEAPHQKFEHKTYIYGPLGWVVLLTEFTLKRLYIIYEW
ncbi:MAG TPA: hypothetical protein DCZ94_13025 [Lentisphaeria bacterium]|nr:MAG: hypothetical protein A2X48_06155 [Lentisphaerae bacterium GWF2_49_21]HBC87871.1 hypothetical protein [Lentisphaeria bacterium]